VNQGSGAIENLSSFGLGGAVVYETEQPRERAGGAVRVTGGNFDTRRIYARYDTGTLGENTRAYMSASQNIFEKWRGAGDQKRFHVEGKLRQDLDNGLISLNLYYDDRDDHDFLDVTTETFATQGRDVDLTDEYMVLPDKAAQADANALYFDAWSNRREDLLLSMNIDLRPSSLTAFRVTPYFHNQDGVGTWMPDYRPDETTADPLAAENRDQTRNTWRETQYELNRYGVTTSLSYALSGGPRVTVGGWAEHSERVQRRVWFDLADQDRYNRDAVRPYWTQFDRNFDTNTYAGFVKGEVDVGPVHVTGGLRTHVYDIAFRDDLSNDESELDDSVLFLPQLGLVWDLSDEHELFGSVSRNFSQVPDGALQQAAPVEPEKSTNLDVGYRYLQPGRSAGLTLFFVDYADKIESIQFGEFDRYANENALQNVGGIRSMGIELTGDLSLGPEFGLFVSTAVSRNRYKRDIEDASEPGGVLPVDDNKAVLTPEVQGFGELSWERAGLRVAVNGKYVGTRAVSLSGTEADPSNQEELDAYTLLGASASYRWNRFSVELAGTNLTDESYLASTSGIGPGASRRPGGGTYFPGSPRWFTVAVGVAF
jgi:iron complex outermembrane receptor protein